MQNKTTTQHPLVKQFFEHLVQKNRRDKANLSSKAAPQDTNMDVEAGLGKRGPNNNLELERPTKRLRIGGNTWNLPQQPSSIVEIPPVPPRPRSVQQTASVLRLAPTPPPKKKKRGRPKKQNNTNVRSSVDMADVPMQMEDITLSPSAFKVRKNTNNPNTKLARLTPMRDYENAFAVSAPKSKRKKSTKDARSGKKKLHIGPSNAYQFGSPKYRDMDPGRKQKYEMFGTVGGLFGGKKVGKKGNPARKIMTAFDNQTKHLGNGSKVLKSSNHRMGWKAAMSYTAPYVAGVRRRKAIIWNPKTKHFTTTADPDHEIRWTRPYITVKHERLNKIVGAVTGTRTNQAGRTFSYMNKDTQKSAWGRMRMTAHRYFSKFIAVARKTAAKNRGRG